MQKKLEAMMKDEFAEVCRNCLAWPKSPLTSTIGFSTNVEAGR